MTGYDSKRKMAADKLHWSDCAVHNGPAYPAGPCDCGPTQPWQEPHGYDWSMLEAAQESLREHMARIKELEAQLSQPMQEPVADRLERLLWEYIDLQAAHPEHKPNPKTWPHLMTYAPLPAQEPVKLWLWKNFVDGKPEYWAFDNPFPIFMDSHDPQTLGEPCGYALLKPSRVGRTDVSDEQVLQDVQKALAQPAQPVQEPEMLTIVYQSGYHDGKQAALAGREWNFCERCGKRTADLTIIHTCTPPQGDA